MASTNTRSRLSRLRRRRGRSSCFARVAVASNYSRTGDRKTCCLCQLKKSPLGLVGLAVWLDERLLVVSTEMLGESIRSIRSFRNQGTMVCAYGERASIEKFVV